MNEQETDQLIEEIAQLCQQYRAEVPGRRRAWPKSIKRRVLQLRQLGLSWSKVSNATRIPVQTLYQWQCRMKQESFKEVVVVSAQPSRKAGRPKERAPTVTVRVGNNVEIAGLTLESAIIVAKELG